MKPTQIELLEKQADVLFKNIVGWEMDALRLIGKDIKKIGKMSVEDIKSFNNISVVQGGMDEITKKLADVTGKNISEIGDIYSKSIEEEHLENKPLYDFRGRTFEPFAENKRIQAIVSAAAKDTAGTMINLAKTKTLCVIDEHKKIVSLRDAYTNIVDKAVIQVSTGVLDFNTAMRTSIESIGGGGLRVDYGGRITRRLDSAIRQQVLWGAKRASIEYNDFIGENLGCDGIEVDWHMYPRPSHEFMNGKRFSIYGTRTVDGVRYEGASEALERLNDYGCYHYKTPVILGVSESAISGAERKRLDAENKKLYEIGDQRVTGYEATQMMRRLETSVRKQSGVQVMAKASGDKSLESEAAKKIERYKASYKKISDITGIKQDFNRLEYVSGKA